MKLKLLILSLIILFGTIAGHTAVVDTLSVPATFIDSPMKVTVITPSSKDKNKRFPTVYLLNGFGGDYKSWCIIQPRLPELADLYGIIIVTPDGRDSWYWDSPIDPKNKMESFITKELVPYIDANHPTIPDAKKRAITGLSMGGHGGLWLGFRHPDIWGNCGSTSGGIDIRPFPNEWKLKELLGERDSNTDIWNNYTVINLVPYLNNPGQNIIIDCGTEDFFKAVNDNLHKALLDRKIKHDYISRPGQHDLDYWKNSILYQLLFFYEAFCQE